jgi:hypothetical protein
MSLGQQQKLERLNHPEIPAEALAALPHVEQITREIFGGGYSSAVAEDHEVAGDRYVEFRVIDNGQLTDVLARNDAWHRRIAAMPVNLSGIFRLVIESDD